MVGLGQEGNVLRQIDAAAQGILDDRCMKKVLALERRGRLQFVE
jgi:hypothetical protein